MAKFVELELLNSFDKTIILVPLSSITSLKKEGELVKVFITGLQMYAEGYYDSAQYANAPAYIETEVLTVANSYDSLKFLILAGS